MIDTCSVLIQAHYKCTHKLNCLLTLDALPWKYIFNYSMVGEIPDVEMEVHITKKRYLNKKIHPLFFGF